ncbi:hypothetical protein [Luteolibacter luteus]|uniref:Uncharacterized protein n=1 Tax=Luteolibacter luteus TaxID=2728835 RepID=A0A858RDI7_9BACT|nr:hypothetical protein [Luteolibacter luteus]QJE94243.1 hypothetical protein HHL09_00070 [Luteolibacter luteus]
MSDLPEDKESNEVDAVILLISKRLLWALGICVVISLGVAAVNSSNKGWFPGSAAPTAAFLAGVFGGFIGIQRRLKTLEPHDLALMSKSLIYTWLSPFIGGLLGFLVYVLFVSGLLAGDLFPKFLAIVSPGDVKVASGGTTSETGVTGLEGYRAGLDIVATIAGRPSDYAKLVFWAFLAGFSENFVTNIVGQFEGKATERT